MGGAVICLHREHEKSTHLASASGRFAFKAFRDGKKLGGGLWVYPHLQHGWVEKEFFMFSAPTDGNGLLVPLVTVIFQALLMVAHTRFLGCV
jgi:hypothetical protein